MVNHYSIITFDSIIDIRRYYNQNIYSRSFRDLTGVLDFYNTINTITNTIYIINSTVVGVVNGIDRGIVHHC